MEHDGDAPGSGSDPNNIPEQLRDRPSALNVNAAQFQPQDGVLRGESSTAMEPNKHGAVFDANNVPEQLRDRLSALNVNAPPFQPQGPVLGASPNAPGFNAIQLPPPGYGTPLPGVAILPTPTIDQFRARLLLGPRHPDVMMVPETAAQLVVSLLDGGDREVLDWAVDAATADVRLLMRSDTGHGVFTALLRASARPSRYHILDRIVKCVASPRGSGTLMDVVINPPGEESLLELFRVIRMYPDQCEMLITCLLRDRMMEHWKGSNLLRNLSSMLPPHAQYHSMFIKFANSNFGRLLSSGPGVGCLMACYTGARYRCHDLELLDDAIVANTSEMAQGEHSYRLLQDVLEVGSVHTEVADRVLADLVALSTHQFGHHVVLACFRLTGSECRRELLRRTLAAFQALDVNRLIVVVLSGYGSSVIHNLLLRANTERPLEARSLATRIRELPEDVQKYADAELISDAGHLVDKVIW